MHGKMNRNHIITLAAALLLTACSQDEAWQRGTPLPEGVYPLELTAGGPETTAAARGTFWEGNWDGVGEVNLSVGGEVKTYAVTPGVGAASLRGKDADNTFWWTSTGETKRVAAWAPTNYTLGATICLPTEWKEEGDFDTYDLIGTVKDINFGDENKHLGFEHLPAKVVVNLRNTPYLRNATTDKIKVTLLSAPTQGTLTVDDNGGLTLSNPTATASVTPYLLPDPDNYEGVSEWNNEKPLAAYMALVVPNSNTAGDILRIDVDGITYTLTTYDLTERPSAVEYAAGKVTTFNVIVNEKSLYVTLNQSSIGWDTNGATADGSVTLPDVTITLDGTNPVEINDNRNYLITGTGTQTVTISGDAHVTFSDVNITTSNGAPIHVTGGSPNLHFNGENVLNCNAEDWGGIAVENGADITLTGDTENAKLTINNSKDRTVGIGAAVIDGYNNPGSSCGNISISKLQLTINTSQGSGIGAAYNSTCGNIEIADCQLNITTMINAACIGASCGRTSFETHCGNITLRNCDIIELSAGEWQQGRWYPAAIGSSSMNAHCKDIHIYLRNNEGIDDFLGKLTVTGGVDKVGVGNNVLVTPSVGTVTWYNHAGEKIDEGTKK